ncbi:MAG TPA: hypothetical protein VN844_30120 [Pyrinomonadaceae bacterium]|nr:hypothetical protein [Pyrinomonadaceae bacterium]
MKRRRFDSQDAREPLLAACAGQSGEPLLVHVFVVDSQPNKRNIQNSDY